LGENVAILGCYEDDLKTYRPKVWEILNFGWFLSLKIQLNYQKEEEKVLEEKFSWVTGSNLG